MATPKPPAGEKPESYVPSEHVRLEIEILKSATTAPENDEPSSDNETREDSLSDDEQTNARREEAEK